MNTLLNIICSKKVKYSILVLFLLFLYVTICAFSYVEAVSTDIANSVFRLHVIANSDSKEDQDLKYIVRDNVLAYMNDLCKDTKSKEEAIRIANEHLDEFKQVAMDTIKEKGFNYDVTVEIGNFSFPTKTYGDISLPSGYYDALRIKIGNADGKNWWCVMFPPLCFVDVSSGIVPDESKEAIKKDLSDEEFSLISNEEDSKISFKFKLIEFFQNAKITTAKN
ncbi:MAG: stage II sporulation protein R [Clostridia bacterium]|nr:stage II sporulation protein R [Clostridia bacterium]